MNGAELKAIAIELVAAGAPALPTIILVREVPLFEIEFAALEFAEEAKLPASDWAVLALARALGQVTPADVDAYLGLGEAVSEGLVHRLRDEGLLQEREPAASDGDDKGRDTGLAAFFRRLLGAESRDTDGNASAPRGATLARRLLESRAGTAPVCVLGPGGERALERGAVTQRRVRPARLVFLDEPLLYLATVDEKRHRFAQHRRPPPLEPDRVPESLRLVDVTMGITPAERVLACGIGDRLRGFGGQLVGVVPGEQWEVRPVARRDRGTDGPDRRTALLVVAAFASSDAEGLRWRVYVRHNERMQDCPHVDPVRLLEPKLFSLSGLLDAVAMPHTHVPPATALRSDGAFGLRCGADALALHLGETDRPDDTFSCGAALRWTIGLRTHAVPTDAAAARVAFFAFLRRRDSELRNAFDGTCASVAAALTAYWRESAAVPSPDEAAQELWGTAELRAALCARRVRADLVDAYEERTEASA